jgi:hypothetical protein
MKQIVQRFIRVQTYAESSPIEYSYEHWEDTGWPAIDIGVARARYPKERYRIVTVVS